MAGIDKALPNEVNPLSTNPQDVNVDPAYENLDSQSGETEINPNEDGSVDINFA